MKVWTGDPLSWGHASSGSAVTIGVFDGVHRGHQAVLSDVAERADDLGGLEQVALTFDVHPLSVVAPTRAPKMLTTVEQRVELLDALGMDHVGVLPFSEIRNSSADGFVSKVLAGAFNAKLVAVGTDFRYGVDRQGDVPTLRRAGLGYGFEVDAVELLEEDGGPISSTTIRSMLAAGEVTEAAELLGRPYELRGTVVEGDQRGRTIGFPTANLVFDHSTALPANGVYAVRVAVGDAVHAAVCNVGVRPTFGGDHVVVEPHLLDFDADIYGEVIKVWFIDRLRDEQRFDGLDALVSQIQADAARARDLLG